MQNTPYKRAERVAQMLQQELGPILTDGLRDPRVGFVTVTAVHLTDDLKSARVFVSVYGDDHSLEDTLAGLEAASGYLKKELSRRITLRYMPKLTFCMDESLAYAKRIDNVIAAIDAGASEPPTPEKPQEIAPTFTERSDFDDSRVVHEQDQYSKRKKGKGHKTKRKSSGRPGGSGAGHRKPKR